MERTISTILQMKFQQVQNGNEKGAGHPCKARRLLGIKLSEAAQLYQNMHSSSHSPRNLQRGLQYSQWTSNVLGPGPGLVHFRYIRDRRHNCGKQWCNDKGALSYPPCTWGQMTSSKSFQKPIPKHTHPLSLQSLSPKTALAKGKTYLETIQCFIYHRFPQLSTAQCLFFSSHVCLISFEPMHGLSLGILMFLKECTKIFFHTRKIFSCNEYRVRIA